jgi:hypothetical protein
MFKRLLLAVVLLCVFSSAALTQEGETLEPFQPGGNEQARAEDYGRYLEHKYSFTSDEDFAKQLQGSPNDPELQQEQRRRGGKSLSVPPSYKQGSVPLPVGAIDKLKTATPEELESFRQHSLGPAYTEEEYKAAHPGDSYAKYAALYNWARYHGRNGRPLQATP